MSVNIQNPRPYPDRSGPGMPEKDWAHSQNVGTDRVNQDLREGKPIPQAVRDVLERAGWDGSRLSGADANALHNSMDSNGHSFAFNIMQGYPELDTDPNTNPEGEPQQPATSPSQPSTGEGGGLHLPGSPAPGPGTGTTPTPGSGGGFAEGEAFGRQNVRDDIAQRIKLWKAKPKGRTADQFVDEIAGYCESGRWSGGGGTGGTGSEGLHVSG